MRHARVLPGVAWRVVGRLRLPQDEGRRRGHHPAHPPTHQTNTQTTAAGAGAPGAKQVLPRLSSSGGAGAGPGAGARVGKRMAAALSLRRFRLEPSADRLRESLLLSRTWRVGVVIERMKDLPETMSLLYLFAPIYSNNSQVRSDCRSIRFGGWGWLVARMGRAGRQAVALSTTKIPTRSHVTRLFFSSLHADGRDGDALRGDGAHLHRRHDRRAPGEGGWLTVVTPHTTHALDASD